MPRAVLSLGAPRPGSQTFSGVPTTACDAARSEVLCARLLSHENEDPPILVG
jgi:hypothetical protein